MAVISLLGAMLVDAGHSDDHALVLAANRTSMLTATGLADWASPTYPATGR
ncbi:hypothetical protein KXD97_24965 [Mycobacterium sp. SMC-8]|nr:hypothetical protein KXD97_24965 [Mycobacterium sp. SMC-8]